MHQSFLQNLRGWLAAFLHLYKTRIQVFAQMAQLRLVEEHNSLQLKKVEQIEFSLKEQSSLLEQAERRVRELSIRVAYQDQQLKMLSAPVSTSTCEAYPANFDQFYLEFENKFRGSMDDIKGRLRVYLPYVQRTISETKLNRVLDIGCGRGEWLELLREHHISGIGVDMNVDMVEKCRVRGLEASCGDAVTYLRTLPQSSVSVITGFHIIEHLPFPAMIAMIDAAFTALTENGIVIFETPNPENLSVGACSFYYDPTHLNPIVPGFAEFTVLQRGFRSAEIVRLHPRDNEKLAETSEVAQRLNELVYGAQDFAVIAKK
jgi:O-antigen chain-terminating methyltransferase